jgi:hypothetical protein
MVPFFRKEFEGVSKYVAFRFSVWRSFAALINGALKRRASPAASELDLDFLAPDYSNIPFPDNSRQSPCFAAARLCFQHHKPALCTHITPENQEK